MLSSCKERSVDNKREVVYSLDSLVSFENPTCYHFMVENSGSMRGYFKENTKAKEFLKNLYDRLDEQLNEDIGDTLTLNYINTEIIPFKKDIESFLQQLWSKCTASYTKLDDILSMALDKASSDDVIFLVSDYCFSSDVGTIETAKSGITNLFAKRLKKSSNLSIVILKFNSDFDGRYYPGGLSCKQSLPFYVWVFGDVSKVKRVIELPNIENDGILVLQPTEIIIPNILAKYARMKGESTGSVKVKEWNKNRYDDFYTLKLKFDISNIIVRKDEILNHDAYKLPSEYSVSNIHIEDNVCTMTIKTSHPSPGRLCIEYQNKLPLWVEKTNFEGVGIPPEGKTLGIKSLIEGVNNAYTNENKNIFTINITLE